MVLLFFPCTLQVSFRHNSYQVRVPGSSSRLRKYDFWFDAGSTADLIKLVADCLAPFSDELVAFFRRYHARGDPSVRLRHWAALDPRLVQSDSGSDDSE
jgi:hypothetical protein